MKILVQHGSSVNEKDEEGKTPLHCAVDGNTKRTASIVEYLLEQGAVKS